MKNFEDKISILVRKRDSRSTAMRMPALSSVAHFPSARQVFQSRLSRLSVSSPRRCCQ